MNNVALVEGRPHTMGLKEMLQVWVDHRRVVIRRRSEYRKKKALERLHLVEGPAASHVGHRRGDSGNPHLG